MRENEPLQSFKNPVKCPIFLFYYIISDASPNLYITLSISIDVVFQFIKKFIDLSVVTDMSIYLELCLIMTCRILLFVIWQKKFFF